MDRKVIEKFLKNNKLDKIFFVTLSEKYLIIESWDVSLDFSIELKEITKLGLNSRNVFFETNYGRFEFLKKEIDINTNTVQNEIKNLIEQNNEIDLYKTCKLLKQKNEMCISKCDKLFCLKNSGEIF